MKYIKYCFTFSAALLIYFSGFSQDRGQVLGIIPSAYSFSTGDILQYSQSTGSFNTARSSAMGGAFASLGGDLASIGINPAGLGMYRSSAWGFSPSVTFSDTGNRYGAYDTSKTRFALNNVGAAINLLERSGGVVGLTLGISYNKAADFNYSTGARLNPGQYSINKLFEQQLNGLYPYLSHGSWNGIERQELDQSPFFNQDIFLDEWGAVLAYLNRAIGAVDDNPANTLYEVTGVGPNASVIPSFMYDSRGSVGEYNFAGGMNINNYLYLGFGLTVQDIYQRQTITYSEEYEYTGSSQSYMKDMTYSQSVTTAGGGVNFKAGLIARPIPALRIGVAVHSPTFISVSHEYIADMSAKFYGLNNNRRAQTELNQYGYNYSSPTRLLAGISYTFGNVAILSADYERIYYNKMRLTSGSTEERDGYRDQIETYFRATNNFRAGVEIKPTQSIAVRAGYYYYGSPLKKGYDLASRFTATTTHGISAGMGFRVGYRTTIDLAYIYSMTDYADLVMFSYTGGGMEIDGNGDESYVKYVENPSAADERDAIRTSDNVRNLRQKRHTVTASFNFMF